MHVRWNESIQISMKIIEPGNDDFRRWMAGQWFVATHVRGRRDVVWQSWEEFAEIYADRFYRLTQRIADRPGSRLKLKGMITCSAHPKDCR